MGVVVHMHPGEAAFVAEFVTLGGSTYAIATVLPAQARNVTTKDVIHTREFALAAKALASTNTRRLYARNGLNWRRNC